MKRLMFVAAALFASACTPPTAAPAPDTSEPSLPAVTLPVADQAGNRMEALTAQTDEHWCSGDGVWCATLSTTGAAITRGDQSAGTIAIGELGTGEAWFLWPQIVRIGRDDATALIGMEHATSQMYSGGGGEASQLILYEVSNGVAHEVARMPLSASSDIRACFSEDDEKQRAGACHDQYKFVTRISLDEGVAEGAPRILLETAAGSFPGRVTREADSTEAPALTEADLVWAHDETCSYRRTYARGADGLYAPGTPVPPCADYLEP